MQLVWDDRTYPITGGIALSMLFHVLLALLIIFGVPSFFEPEVLEAPPTIELAKMADITAAPKVDKAGKPQDKPQPPAPPAPEPPKPTPPKPATPATPSKPTPPPPTPEKTVTVPDEQAKPKPEEKKPDKKPDEKKPDKKPDDKPKPKPKPEDNQDFNKLLADLTKNQPAPDTKAKAQPKAQAAPAQPTTGQKTDLVNDVPLTMGEQDAIRAAIEKNWVVPYGMANIEKYVVMLRLHLTPDGVVTAIDVLNDTGDPGFKTIADGARRAIEITQNDLGRLPIPKDKYNATMIVRWNMAEICAEMGC
jgi:outer membrane biosynthesis protein TonB